jgi:hypothetical protein
MPDRATASSGVPIANRRHSLACARHRLLLSIIEQSCAHWHPMASKICHRPEPSRHTLAAFTSSEIANRKPQHVRCTVVSWIKRSADLKGSRRLGNADRKESKSRELAMNNLILDCREVESLCRQRAISDRGHSWKWLGEADRWSDLAHQQNASHLQNTPMHTGPMAMGPNTIEGDSRRREHKSLQRLQSVTRGG